MNSIEKQTECTFSILSENHPGILHRIAVLFTRRKINIESLTVSGTEHKDISRFTIVVKAFLDESQKIAAQLRRIIEVCEVTVHENRDLIYKEIAFFRVSAPDAHTRQFISSHAIQHGASVVSIDPEALVLEKTGTEEELHDLLRSFANFHVLEFIRSGRIAVARYSDEQVEPAEIPSYDSTAVIM